MTTSLRSFALTIACCLWAAVAGAQTPSPSDSDIRPATPTFTGDAGLWFVPTAETLPRHKWSVSGYRVGLNYREGFTNVGAFAGNFAFGLFSTTEVFGSFHVDTRINRDLRPVFTSNRDVGGVVLGHPLVKTGWTGDNIGDLYIGAKSTLVQQKLGKRPYSLALREVFKIPTADKEEGIGTGRLDASIQGVLSSDVRKRAEISGYGGVFLRRSMADVTMPKSSFIWGLGAAFPSHSPLRVTTEVQGDVPFKDTATVSRALVAFDGSRVPTTQNVPNSTAATLGLTWRARNGFFVGGAATWNLPTKDRTGLSTQDTDVVGDFVDYHVRIGFHPGVRQFVPPAPPPPPPPPPPPVQPNRPPTVTAQCNPCTVLVVGTSTVTATAQDPDGDVLTYRWSAPTGTFQNPAVRETIWTAPQQEAPVPVTVTVDDGKGGTASASVRIQVVRPVAVVELNFEDVYFDFDRSTLRPEALRLLDDAISRLLANPGRNIIIEGHTCNIGTAEYNLALGERRAASVRAYLLSNGVTAGRMETRSFGEERPKFDNAREETRRLNRRASLVVRVQ